MSSIKTLVRNNSEQEADVLEDSEFITVALVQISTQALALKDTTQSEDLLVGMANILELMQEVLVKNNITPIDVVQYAANLRAEHGSFSDKKYIQTDEVKE